MTGDGNVVEIAFLIADISGYTALTQAHGDLHAADTVERFAQLARSALDPGARLLEQVGDELLIAGETAAPVIRTALALRTASEREPLFPELRAGIHGGRVLEREGRYFGAALNLTARVAAHARGGQVLCTESIAGAAQALTDVKTRALAAVRLKNVVEPVLIYEILGPDPAREPAAVDPVCRMAVRPDTAPALSLGARTYYFCSLTCVQTFAASPERYLES